MAKQFDTLVQHTQDTGLTLDSPREEWSNLIANCITCPERKTQT